MQFKLLEASDAARLFQFELENRAWFEQHIEARLPSFYCVTGVYEHIQENLDNLARGVTYPYLLLDETDKLIGRANLKEIRRDEKSAEIGYRIARDSAGRGHASAAVEFLKSVALDQLGLTRLIAFASIENPASTRVLEKCGFVQAGLLPGLAVLKDRTLDCHTYVFLNT